MTNYCINCGRRVDFGEICCCGTIAQEEEKEE
jgi:hypothetical protein